MRSSNGSCHIVFVSNLSSNSSHSHFLEANRHNVVEHTIETCARMNDQTIRNEEVKSER
jgi:hypothetical protein